MRLSRITLLILALSIGAGFLLLTRYLLEDLEEQTMQATEEAMVDFVQVMAADLSRGGSWQDWDESFYQAADAKAVDALIFRHRKNDMGLSFYVTDADGIVLHDSAGEQRPGTDLSHMRDVRLTLDGRYGARSSRLRQGEPMTSVLHIAAPIYAEGRDADITGVVTLRKAQADVLPFVLERRQIITTSAVLIASGIVLFTIAVFVWLWRPIGRLTQYARAITEGERPQRPKLGSGREVNTLGNALYTMRDKLAGRGYVEQYVQTLTHELKSPLAGIRGAAEILQEDLPAKQRAHFAGNIERESQRMTDLISGLLQLSSLEGKDALQSQSDIDLAELASTSIAQLGSRADSSEVLLQISAPDSPQVVQGDATLLGLALTNVIENAISFSPPGSTIHVAVDSESPRLTITDHGPGIPDYAGEQIFQRFYTLERPDCAGVKSTGLGLAFVRECMTLHGGEVTYTSQPGETIFTLSFPV